MQNIEEIRLEINNIDDQILELLNQRMECVKQIGALKQKTGTAIYRPEREKAILERLSSSKTNKLSKEVIEAIFYEIFAVSRNLEMPQKVAFLGPIGTYTHQAAQARFGTLSSYIPLSTIEAVFKVLDNGEAKFGVVPIENNTEGAVNITLDCLKKYEKVKIVAELYMDIHHSFASISENISNINKIYSHPQGYAQCRKFLDDHGLGEIEFIPTKSTAQAAELALKDETSAAICSKIAAHMNKLPILFETIEDNNANRTRFFVLSDFKNARSDFDKTSVIFKTGDRPGDLFNFLSMFKEAKVNITKLESRPTKQRNFKQVFYMDFLGHIDDENVQNIVKKAKDEDYDIRWLGSYINQEG